jgi:hypothetical protein
MAERRQGQRGFTRRRGVPRPPPGLVQQDLRQTPEFQAWVAKWGNPAISTVPEYMCFRWLEKQGYVAGLDFEYLAVEAGMGRRIGSQQVDFLIGGWLVWAVQGVFFHWQLDPSQVERDVMSRAILESRGYVVVWLLDLDIVAHVDSTCRKAIVGVEEPGAQEGKPS